MNIEFRFDFYQELKVKNVVKNLYLNRVIDNYMIQHDEWLNIFTLTIYDVEDELDQINNLIEQALLEVR